MESALKRVNVRPISEPPRRDNKFVSGLAKGVSCLLCTRLASFNFHAAH